MLEYLRSSALERTVKSNIFLLLLSDKLIENLKFLLPYEDDWNFFKTYKIPKNNVIIDIGAHWGESTITFRKFYPKNKIISFEPNRHIFKKLEKNTKKLNVKIFNYGIGKKKEDYLFFPYYKNQQLSLWGSQNLKNLKKRIKQFTYLDPRKIKFKMEKVIFKKFPNVNYKIGIIKIDVEGEEFKVIHLLSSIIEKNKPLLFVEYHENNFKKVFYFLKKKNYRSYYFFKNRLFRIAKLSDLKSVLLIKQKRTLNIIFKL